jgi:hypothetical protein
MLASALAKLLARRLSQNLIQFKKGFEDKVERTGRLRRP